MEKTNKLLEFQKRVGSILKEATNPFYKSKYFDINGLIESIKPILNELNLTLTQPISIGGIDGNKNILNTFLKDGETVIESSSIILPENIDPQKLGSAITYFRRYSIQSMLLLQAEDDDGSLGKKPMNASELSHKEQTAEPNAFKEMKEAKDLETVKKIWTENKSLQHDSVFAGLKEKRKSELTPLKEHPLNEPNKITVDDILPGEVEEVKTETFVKDTIADLQKCKTVTGMNTKFREIRNMAGYMFLEDSDKNQITEFCKTKKAELNEKK